jgi:hypothetical protein
MYGAVLHSPYTFVLCLSHRKRDYQIVPLIHFWIHKMYCIKDRLDTKNISKFNYCKILSFLISVN